jgi:phosphohistidine phosphatase SixA
MHPGTRAGELRAGRPRPVGTVVGGNLHWQDDDALLAALGVALADNPVGAVRVFALRHGRYDRGAEVPDNKRALTPGGEFQAIEAAGELRQRLSDLGRTPVVLHSPYRRAQQTAKPIAGAFGVVAEQRDWLCPEQNLDELMMALAGYPAGTVVILVGHEPMLDELFLLASARGSLGYAEVNEFLFDLETKKLMLVSR